MIISAYPVDRKGTARFTIVRLVRPNDCLYYPFDMVRLNSMHKKRLRSHVTFTTLINYLEAFAKYLIPIAGKYRTLPPSQRAGNCLLLLSLFFYCWLLGNYIIILSTVQASTNPKVKMVPTTTCLIALSADLNFGFITLLFSVLLNILSRAQLRFFFCFFS